MDAEKFLQYLQQLDGWKLNNIILKCDIVGILEAHGIEIGHAIKSARSTLVGTILRGGNMSISTREGEIFMQDDKVIYTSDLGRQIRIAARYERKSPNDAEMFLDGAFEAKRMGFENLFRLDEVIRENVTVTYEDEQIVCKFIGK